MRASAWCTKASLFLCLTLTPDPAKTLAQLGPVSAGTPALGTGPSGTLSTPVQEQKPDPQRVQLCAAQKAKALEECEHLCDTLAETAAAGPLQGCINANCATLAGSGTQAPKSIEYMGTEANCHKCRDAFKLYKTQDASCAAQKIEPCHRAAEAGSCPN